MNELITVVEDKAILDSKMVEDLIIVVNMLMQKEETDKQKIKEYK